MKKRTNQSRTLECQNLAVAVDGKPILRGVNLSLRTGELNALMGPNGSGKSTLALTLMGHPRYQVTGGRILLDGADIATWTPEQRAAAGLFLSFQYPQEVAGVPFAQFLRTAYHAVHRPKHPVTFQAFHEQLLSSAGTLNFPEAMLSRSVNEGFSGGEKKRAEVFQMDVLGPAFAILDEPDSGLDIDSLKTVAAAINRFRSPATGLLLITHYPRMLEYLRPDRVHVFGGGRVVRSGGPELALELERTGYEAADAKTTV